MHYFSTFALVIITVFTVSWSVSIVSDVVFFYLGIFTDSNSKNTEVRFKAVAYADDITTIANKQTRRGEGNDGNASQTQIRHNCCGSARKRGKHDRVILQVKVDQYEGDSTAIKHTARRFRSEDPGDGRKMGWQGAYIYDLEVEFNQYYLPIELLIFKFCVTDEGVREYA